MQKFIARREKLRKINVKLKFYMFYVFSFNCFNLYVGLKDAERDGRTKKLWKNLMLHYVSLCVKAF